jgi:hypothetical protein
MSDTVFLMGGALKGGAVRRSIRSGAAVAVLAVLALGTPATTALRPRTR